MAKKTQIDKAIEQLDSEIAVLQAARLRLVQQQAKVPKRRPKLVSVGGEVS
jgi:hypothetical protein